MAIPMQRSNASKSPSIGINAIFGHKMVTKKINLDVFCKKVPAMRASGKAYNLAFLTQNSSSKGNEQKAADWIKLCLRRNSSFSILPASAKIPCLKDLGAFHTTDDIRPDVTVLHTHDVPVPCFTVEVVSSTYEDTLKRTVINAIEQLRLMRAYDATVKSSVGYVFPNAEASFVTKVEVKFEEFTFCCNYKAILTREDVAADIGSHRSQWRSLSQQQPCYDYFIQLSTAECNEILPPGLRSTQSMRQKKSKRSLLLHDQPGNAYWKYSVDHSLYAYLWYFQSAEQQSQPLPQPPPPLLQHTLLPVAEKKFRNVNFFKFESLLGPLNRREAKDSLKVLLLGIKQALVELHEKDIAHLDLRLPNICFTPHYLVKLIDLDRCEPASDTTDGVETMFCASDMYRASGDDWTCKHLDWKALGMLICFVLEDALENCDYHQMLEQNKAQSPSSHRFVEDLVQQG